MRSGRPRTTKGFLYFWPKEKLSFVESTPVVQESNIAHKNMLQQEHRKSTFPRYYHLGGLHVHDPILFFCFWRTKQKYFAAFISLRVRQIWNLLHKGNKLTFSQGFTDVLVDIRPNYCLSILAKNRQQCNLIRESNLVSGSLVYL